MTVRRGYLRYGKPGAWRSPSPTVVAWINRIFDQPEPKKGKR